MQVGCRSNTRPEKNIQPSNDNSTLQRLALSSELRDRRFKITDDFYKTNAAVFRRQGTRPEQPTESFNDHDKNKYQPKQPKPPNYSRINSTIKLVRPSMQSGLRSSTTPPKVSYSSVVKRPMKIESTTRIPSVITRSTLISTTDAPRPTTNMQGSEVGKEPFKLIPVMPPKKHDVVKNYLTVANSSKINNLVPNKVEMFKSKLKTTKQRRSLSPVQEDMHVESTTDTLTSN